MPGCRPKTLLILGILLPATFYPSLPYVYGFHIPVAGLRVAWQFHPCEIGWA